VAPVVGVPPVRVTVNGCFDILHIGHLRFLAAARAMGGALTVLINDDASVARYKGPTRPVFPEGFRSAALKALVSVDDVVMFAEDEPLAAIAAVKPDIHVKGGSFEPERVRHERELVARWGGRLVGTPLEEGFSTSSYIQKVLKSGAG
jgi:D-beta-D-heptose 7-phosphate kinase/D-beta-D-heptose 1-phosphate adenosyltransferase